MFNKNFYPSPIEVIRLLTNKMIFRSGTRVLEPSAGKGDIADYIKKTENFKKIDVIEKENELSMILSEKGYSVISYDFLTFNTFTEYDYIVMNPPFDDGASHLIHAINLAKRQSVKECSIRCILNAETLRNPFSNERKYLNKLLEENNAEITFHSDLFKNAERKTDVETAVVKLTISSTKNKVKSIYADIVSSLTDEAGTEKIVTALSTIVKNNEVVKRVADIKTLVRQYNFHVELLKKEFSTSESIQYFESLISDGDRRVTTYFRRGETDINESIEKLRKDYWRMILNTKEFEKKLTKHGRDQLINQIANAGKLEITVENIEMLLIAVMQNSHNIILESCIEMFERFTRYHQREFSQNIHYYTGWKTNDAYKINKKIILPINVTFGSIFGIKFSNNYDELDREVRDQLEDINKMFLMFDNSLDVEFRNVGGTKFENDLLKFQIFKKGTMHIWFERIDLLDQMNIMAGQHFNWIPQEDEIKADEKAKEFMKKNFTYKIFSEKIIS